MKILASAALLLCALSTPLEGQSVLEFPRWRSVSTVTVVPTISGAVIYLDLEPVIPEPMFRDWWAEMEACVGIQAPYDSTTWFLADAILNVYPQPPVTTSDGHHWSYPPEIILLRGLTILQTEEVAKHEILHELLGNNTIHRDSLFLACS